MSEEKTAKQPVLWDLWQKDRTFVRALVGKYGEVYRQLLEQPRVYKNTNFPFKGGPTFYDRHVIDPGSVQITQAIEAHLDVIAPGSTGAKHGHMNSAVFFVLEGKGYDVHDGKRIEWEAGDAMLVENGCVHQHFNTDLEHKARVLVLKAKPAFLFFHLLFQKTVQLPPTEPVPGFENMALDW